MLTTLILLTALTLTALYFLIASEIKNQTEIKQLKKLQS